MKTMGYDFDLDVTDLHLKEDTIFEYLKEYNCLYMDSGRTCIKTLSRLVSGRELLVPAFSCISVISGFVCGVRPVFYAVHDNFSIDFSDLESKITKDTAGIYVTNYFGHMINDIDRERINRIKKEHNLLVFEDNTQSVFSGSIRVGDYALASIRKWFPVPDGSVIYSTNPLTVFDIRGLAQESRQYEKLYPQIIKSMVIKNQIDYPVSKIADLFAAVEKQLDNYTDAGEAFLMGDFTEFVYHCQSIPHMVRKRRENEQYLRTLIHSPYLRQAIERREENECPFNMPMYCSCRDKMWNYLVENFDIYPSVLWRTHLYEQVKGIGSTARMGREIISFPIDQRYSKSDMEYMADAINRFKA